MKKPVKAIKGVNKRYDLPSGKREYSDPGLDAMSKVLVERNKNLNFIDRAKNQNTYPSVQTKSLRGFENEDPAQRSTHLMTNGYDDRSKKFTTYPTVEYDGVSKQLVDKGPDAYGNWPTPSEVIQTTGGPLASYFAERGMKDNTGLARSEDAPLPESSIVAKKKSIVQLRKGLRYK